MMTSVEDVLERETTEDSLRFLERQAAEVTNAREAQLEAIEEEQEDEKDKNKSIVDSDSPDHIVDFMFQRYGFILWSPLTLLRRLAMRDHPLTGIFCRHLRMLALERTLIFSCSLIGSLMAASLFFGTANVGEMVAVPPPPDNSTPPNETDPSTWQIAATTTTTTTPLPVIAADESAQQTKKMLMQVIISIFSIVIALIPATTLLVLFNRRVFREYVPRRRQKKLLKRWRRQRYAGYVIGGVFLLYCYYFLFMFAANKPMDMQTDFTVSSCINLVWKVLLKPTLAFLALTGFISGVRTSTLFDTLFFSLPPAMFDFSMFTTMDLDDHLAFEEMLTALAAFDAGDAIAGGL